MFTVLKRVAPGLVLAKCRRGFEAWQPQLWSRVTARKATRCFVTEADIHPGDAVYRPVSNGSNRMLRVLATALDK